MVPIQKRGQKEQRVGRARRSNGRGAGGRAYLRTALRAGDACLHMQYAERTCDRAHRTLASVRARRVLYAHALALAWARHHESRSGSPAPERVQPPVPGLCPGLCARAHVDRSIDGAQRATPARHAALSIPVRTIRAHTSMQAAAGSWTELDPRMSPSVRSRAHVHMHAGGLSDRGRPARAHVHAPTYI